MPGLFGGANPKNKRPIGDDGKRDCGGGEPCCFGRPNSGYDPDHLTGDVGPPQQVQASPEGCLTAASCQMATVAEKTLSFEVGRIGQLRVDSAAAAIVDHVIING
ncbi:hypothetical protein Rhe02_33780 [Rhizocola hellebori]|uniref:Uncharacterized protein n=1 Tax=Rhizocola hellebori TaxID=1392758 RepID=A0A8J3Q7K8_9ACTN|nr:hypothetical protein Rhe02_33780 [Rhizocola hellebori]